MFKFDYKEDVSNGGDGQSYDWRNLQNGKAKFRVTKVFTTDKDGKKLVTAKGDDKMKVSLFCEDMAGNKGSFFETLTGNTPWKVKSLLDAVGMGHLYNASGMFAPDDLEGLDGQCIIEREKNEYGEYMRVKKYFAKNVITEQTQKVDYSMSADDLASLDDIPF